MSGMGTGQGFSQLASGAIRLAYAQAQKKDANRRLNRLGEMPDMVVPQEVLQNQTQAKINAEQGLPSAQYNQAVRNIQRQQNAAIRGAQDRRMGGALISGVQQSTNDAYSSLDARNAMARLNNQRTLMDVNNNIGRYRQAIYENYIRNKYIPQYNYAMSEKGAGNANTIAGLDSVIAGGSSLAGGMGGGSGGGGFNMGSFGGGGTGGSAISNPQIQQIGGSGIGYVGG